MRGLDAIVLDLDDTLYATSVHLLPWADRRAAVAMRHAGLALAEAEILGRIAELRAAGSTSVFQDLVRAAGGPAICAEIGQSAFLVYDPPPMTLDDDVARALDALQAMAPLALLTGGDPGTQRRKLERLGLARRFVAERFVASCAPGAKAGPLREILEERGWRADRTVLAGDRLDGDVRAGNRVGCLTVHVRPGSGEFAGVVATSPDDVPWRTIAHVRELPALLRAASA